MHRAIDDPWERRIKVRLAEKIDPDLFEECACDVLRDAYPTLARVPGGKDKGMDGAIADGKGEPYPLICTTSKDLKGICSNLKKSIGRYLETGGPRRQAVLATSLSLNRETRDELTLKAQEKGILLEQIFGQEDFVPRLRHHTHWCRKLLGISGKPPALSIVPVRHRHPIDIEPVGRGADQKWREAREDRLLTGPPGSGKTFLLYHLAREGWGLFLVRDEEEEVLQAIAEQEPEVIIIDDAHEDLSRLERLRHLRETSEKEFAIVATTWDGDRDRVARALGDLPSSRIQKLELLTRDEIVEVFRRAGVEAPDPYMKMLVDQAANKPGLAMTLAQLWLHGDWLEVLEGRALSRSLRPFFEHHVGKDAEQILAAFSLGGDRGLPMNVVAHFLNLSPSEVQRKAIALAAGGVLSEARGVLSVWPRQLRSVLLANVFFRDDGININYRELLAKAPSFDKAVKALIDARAYSKAAVPMKELRDLVSQARSPEIWGLFAGLGASEAQWVLESYPLNNWLDIADSAIYQAPYEVIPRLLRHAADELATGSSPLRSRPSSLTILASWIRQPRIPLEERLARRRHTADAARQFLQSGVHHGAGVAAIYQALFPILSETSQDPGSGKRIRKRTALVTVEELAGMRDIWEGVRDVFTQLDSASWFEIKKLLGILIAPLDHVPGVKPRPECLQEMRALAAEIMRHLAPLTKNSPAFAAGLDRIASKINVTLPLEHDADFDLLFPQDYDHDQGEKEERRRRIRMLAARWATDRPDEVFRQLRRLEDEALRIEQRGSPCFTALIEGLASDVPEPDLWARDFLDRQADVDWVYPFLNRIVECQTENWEELVERCLESETYLERALSIVLCLDPLPPQFLGRLLAQVPRFPQLVFTLCLWKAVPESTLALLLGHSDRVTAGAAAVGEWSSEPRSEVRANLRDYWKTAILALSPRDLENESVLSSWLTHLLEEDSRLALEWLRSRLRRDEIPQFSQYDSLISRSLNVLDHDQRIRLLRDLATKGSSSQDLIRSLVGRDRELYKGLLSEQRLACDHLAPLAGVPDEAWSEMALLALEHGYRPREVAGAAFEIPHSPGSWRDGFLALLSHPDRNLREVAEYGMEIVELELDSLRESEREIELRGVHRD